jgi:peptidoglycan lytic transglycosylase D
MGFLASCQISPSSAANQEVSASTQPQEALLVTQHTSGGGFGPIMLSTAPELIKTPLDWNMMLAVQPTPATLESHQAPQTPDLWREMRAHMTLDLYLEQKRVQQELRWLKRHPTYLKRLQDRLQAYLPYIYTQTQIRGLPAELALLPIVESALDTFAFSHGGAAGPWQFVRGTARQYGLEINDWYDGRRDVIASTDAALNYLTDLHKRFDSWYLALAGYNAGQGNVNRALRRNPGAGFFDLRLPRETQAYVPRLLALAAIIRDPDAHGITLPEIKPITSFLTVDTHSQFQLTKLSQTIGIDMDTLYRWNPALNQWATPPQGPHRIIVPSEIDAKLAQSQIDAIPAKQRVDWTEIRVKSGDTLSQIARRHGTDVASLRMANNLSGSNIRVGHKLLIPKSAKALQTTPRSAKGTIDHVVRNGDSLWSIARAYNVSLNTLMRNNHLGPKDTLSVGRTLKIPGATAATRKVTRKVHYKVRSGDSLARIAGKFNVRIADIASWNNLDTKRYLQPGQGLLLYVNVIGG